MRRRGALAELALFVTAALALWIGFAPRGAPAPSAPSERPPPGALRIVTWNVGSASQEGARALADDELEHVARVLRGLAPELCFLQEVRSAWQARRLAAALGEDWTASVSGGARGRRVVALARRAQLTALPLPRDDASIGVLYRSPAGPLVRAVGVHADAFSAARRNELLGALADALLASGEADVRVLAGDCNLDLDLDKRRDLFSDDAYLDVETYNYLAERYRDAARGTGATAEPDRRLDYLFLDAPGWDVVGAGPWRGERTGDMDHDPLVVDLRGSG